MDAGAFCGVVFGDDYLFYFVKLMDAVEAVGVLAVSSGFAAETGGEGTLFFR